MVRYREYLEEQRRKGKSRETRDLRGNAAAIARSKAVAWQSRRKALYYQAKEGATQGRLI